MPSPTEGIRMLELLCALALAGAEAGVGEGMVVEVRESATVPIPPGDGGVVTAMMNAHKQAQRRLGEALDGGTYSGAEVLGTQSSGTQARGQYTEVVTATVLRPPTQA